MSDAGRAPGADGKKTRDEVMQILAERLHYMRLEGDDLAALASCAEPIDENMSHIIGGFYEHLRKFAVLRPFLDDPIVATRLERAQTNYVRTLTRDSFDTNYVDSQTAIGHTHERIGIGPQWYVGAYGVLLEMLIPVIEDACADEAHRRRATQGLVKRILLDIQLALDAYFETRNERQSLYASELAALGELAANIAHEVRNPLAGIRGVLEVIGGDKALEDDSREAIGEVMRQVDRLDRLVGDLLTFSRPRTASQRRVALDEVLQRASSWIGESNHVSASVALNLDDDACVVIGDAEQLEQVFLNLVQNAAQAMDSDDALIRIRSHREGDSVHVVVHDNGPGIPTEILNRVFQPFFTTKHVGSGLGLSIANKIVAAHGGSISIESKPDSGTDVTVVLPCALKGNA